MSSNVAALVPQPPGGPQPPAVIPGYPGGYGEVGMFDMANIRAILWRQRWVLVLVTAAGLLAGLVITLLMTPVYFASATVRIDTQNAQIIEGQELIDPYIASNEVYRHLETLKTVIESRSMALRVVDDVGLEALRPIFGEDYIANPTPAQAEEMRQIAAATLMSEVAVELPINTRIIAIGYYSTDPQLAARLANAYATNFLRENVGRSIEANAYAREYLENEIAATRERLRAAEMRAIEYARANRIIGQFQQGEFGQDVGTAPTLTLANLTSTASQLAEARGARIAAEQRWRTVANLPAEQLPEVRENPTIEGMMTRAAQLRAQLADLRERYRDDFPQVRGLLAEIDTLERQITRMSNEVKNSIRNDYEIARRQEAALEAAMAQISEATLDEQDRRVQYNLITREVAANRDQLAVLLDRYNQIASAANIQRNDATLLDSAVVPTAPASPRLFTNLFLALIAGFGLAVAIAVLREVFDDRLRSIEDVEEKLKVPALGQTPFVNDAIEDELGASFSPISEAYSSIRATLDFALPKGGHHVLQFTSSQPGEGKTTSAIALASRFANLGRRVLLIDLDLRKPSLHKALGLGKPEVGVVDVLHMRVSLEKALRETGTENLFVLPVGRIPHNPVEILSSGLVPEFLHRHRRDFDVIVIDSSPVLGLADAPLLSRFVDAVVFVIEANRSHFGAVRNALRRLRDMNANIIGVTLTKFRALEAGKDYNYHYQYYAYGER